jgi:hypothetical protein
VAKPDKITLAEARKRGDLDRFIREHGDNQEGDAEAFEKTVSVMAGTSSAARPASKKGNRGG